MRFGVAMKNLALASSMLFAGCSKHDELGLAYQGETRAENVKLLVDETWTDAGGNRQVKQEIFSEVFQIIDEAEQFVLIDFFLMNEFLYEPGPGLTNLSREFADKIIAKKAADPGVAITFISDPVNTVYGSIESPLFSAMEAAGVNVVWTDHNPMRDSNRLYSVGWRIFAKPFGVSPGNVLVNPMGEGRISARSMMKLLNFKANHRKVVVTEKTLLITSANPHSGSSAHWNVALRVDGAGMKMACESESAILKMSGAKPFDISQVNDGKSEAGYRLELLTERRIRERVLGLLDAAEPGERVDLAMFYLSHKDVIQALINAQKRGADVRVILDPAKDAFGRIKNGIPNRQSAKRLTDAGIALRWADTHGEQCHVKMLYVEHADETATLLLGSCNYTRRNMDDYNAECNLAVTVPNMHDCAVRARETFDRWWSNPDERFFTTEYATYADPSVRRRLRAWMMERTGLSTF